MWLAVDVGNTNVVLGLFDGQSLRGKWRISTHPIGTSDEFLVKLKTLVGGVPLKHVVVSSVVPQFTSMLRHAFDSKTLLVIDSSWQFSFGISAHPPEQVGADRLVNAEAVLKEYGAPTIIVDSGTATTLCAVAERQSGSAYLGGAIMPGLELSLETLAKHAARLYMVELRPPTHAIGTNTSEALRSGILFGYASMIDGMIKRFKAELSGENRGKVPKVVATGGVSELLKDIALEITHHDSDLTLKGIRYLYEKRISH